MDNINNKIKVVLLSAVFLFLSISSAADDETKPPFNIIDAANRLYSLPTASDAGAGLRMSLQPAPNLE